MPRRENDDYARTKGWHIWSGTTMSGMTVGDLALCPEHAGNMKRQTAPVQIEGEQTLF